MSETDRMECPGCGAEMNHHADKLVYGAAADGAPDEDAAGVLIEAHACPACGRTATREAVGGGQ